MLTKVEAPSATAAAALLELAPGNVDAVATLLGPRGVDELRERLSRGQCLALAAIRFLAAVGMVEAGLDGPPGVAPIRTLFVVPKQRSRGVGTLLLQGAERRLSQRGWPAASILSSRPPGAGALPLDRVLQKCGWPPARKRSDIFRIDQPLAVLDEPWMQSPLPAGFELFPWAEITEEELDAIRCAEEELQKDGDYISPLIEGVDPVASTGLRYRGSLAGWMVNRRPRPDLQVFDRFYIYPRYRGLRASVPLLAASIHTFLTRAPCRAMFQAPAHLPRQATMYVKLLGRHLRGAEEEWASEKVLGPAARGPATQGS